VGQHRLFLRRQADQRVGRRLLGAGPAAHEQQQPARDGRADRAAAIAKQANLCCDIDAARIVTEGLRLLDSTRPDVLLVDIGLPSGSGIELIRHAYAHLPQCETMVVPVFADDRRVLGYIEAGATGYLLKGHRPRRPGAVRARHAPRRRTHCGSAGRLRFLVEGTLGATGQFGSDGLQIMLPPVQPVPEPGTAALWFASLPALASVARRRATA